MPQMSPMLWLMIMIFTLITLFMLISIIYFLNMKNKFNFAKNKKLLKKYVKNF